MKLSVPTNWSPELINKLDKTNITEIYGKLDRDAVGGARPEFLLPFVSRRQVSDHIRLIHENGLKFNYLLNALCMGNHEWTAGGQKRIRKLLDWLAGAGVDNITVAVPYLLQLIKRSYPFFKVKVSVCAGIDNPVQARHWEDMGADVITLSPWSLNRDFILLKQIRRAVKCNLELYANNRCLIKCPFANYHYLANNHASNSQDKRSGFFIDYCRFMCNFLILSQPSRLISSCWIRPDDSVYYADAGVDSFKLSERNTKTEFILRIVEAYTRKKYEGNLFDLFVDDSKRLSSGNRCIWKKILFFLKPSKVNIFILQRYFSNLSSQTHLFLDNRKLDGFLDFFIKGKCNLNNCDECGYCRQVAQEALIFPDDSKQKILQAYKELLGSLYDGSAFYHKSK
ncbi:MAG: U32 family peptidase [Candidatus Omnitrophica bacterium]|nr:U32 family peptidase [Candidatus Omnitrophota bacterium]